MRYSRKIQYTSYKLTFKKLRHYQSYKMSFQGWSNYRIIVLENSSGIL